MKSFTFGLVIAALVLLGCGGAGGSGGIAGGGSSGGSGSSGGTSGGGTSGGGTSGGGTSGGGTSGGGTSGGGSGNSERTQLEAAFSSEMHGMDNLRQPTNGPLLRAFHSKTRSTRVHSLTVSFDPTLQLYVQDFSSGDPSGFHTAGAHYFKDAALTQTAGDDVQLYHWELDPKTEDETQTVTVGPHSGQTLTEHSQVASDGSGEDIGNFDDGLHHLDSWNFTWDPAANFTFTERFTKPDQSWVQYDGYTTPQGGTHFAITSSSGLTLTFDFAPDSSGSGTITGSSSLLPATFSWDTTFSGSVHWADGATTTFTDWGF